VEVVELPKGTKSIEGRVLSYERTGQIMTTRPPTPPSGIEPEGECCYQWAFACKGGRPLLDGGEALVARPVAGTTAWIGEALAVASPDDPGLRDALAAAWLEDALAEHASVAAFARATLELMAVGAPPELLAETQRAGLDEIRHAQLCFGLAAAYGSAEAAPGPLVLSSDTTRSNPEAPSGSDLARLARSTLVEGCIGETIAALVAARAAARCTDPVVAQVLRSIADDESRHAALAWSILRWALEQGDRSVAQQLERERAAATRGPRVITSDDRVDAPRFGRLGPQATRRAALDAWTGIITPMLDELLGSA